MTAVPGYQRDSSESPRGDCGCLFWAAAIGLLFAAAMLALGLYATNLVEPLKQ